MSESTTGSKLCLRCDTVKPVDQFYKQARAKDGLQHCCAECSRAKARQWYEQNRERSAATSKAWRERIPAHIRRPPERRQGQRLKEIFHLTHEQYMEMYQAQGGVCALCGQAETHISNKSGRVRWLSVDHDHRCCPDPSSKTCGKCVRGLLCHRCNLGIGKLRDDPDLLRRAADYIEKYRVE